MNRQRADDAPDRCYECGSVEVLYRCAGHLVCADCRQVMEDGSDRWAVDTMMAMLAVGARSWA